MSNALHLWCWSGLSALLTLLPSGCTVSLQTVSLPPEIKTFRVEQFPNNAAGSDPGLGITFTDALRNKFLSQTRLQQTDTEADLTYSGAVVQYDVQPVNIASNDQAAQNRLTLSVQVKLENKLTPKSSWEQRFSAYQDFDQGLSLATIESDLIAEINDLLTQQIFNQTFGNW